MHCTVNVTPRRVRETVEKQLILHISLCGRACVGGARAHRRAQVRARM